MKFRLLITTICHFLCIACFPQLIHDYTLNFIKTDQDKANLHIKCTFVLDFQNSDSISMNFGGAQGVSIDDLKIENSESDYKDNWESKNIIFWKRNKQVVHISMTTTQTCPHSSFIEKETPNYGKPALANIFIHMFQIHIWT